ncbi:MAG: ABC transporter substrate-binding protein, partial [Actinomycetota bacterium]
ARGTSRRMRLGGIAAAALVGVGVATLLLTLRGGTEALAANSVAALDTTSGKPKAVVAGSTDVSGFIRDGDAFWGVTAGGRVLQQIDAQGNKVGRQIALPVAPNAFAPNVVQGSIWATDPHEPPTVLRIDARYGTIQRIDLHAPKVGKESATQVAEGIDATKNAVWVTYAYPKRIARINPVTGAIVFEHRVPDGGSYFNSLVAANGDNVWVVDRSGLHMTRIDPNDGSLAATGPLHDGWVEDARVAGGSLWLAVQNDGGVWQLNKRANVVGKVATGNVPYSIATDGGPLWVANANSGTVTGIDPVSGEITKTFRTGHRPIAVGAGRNEVWVSLGLGDADARARVSGSNVVHMAGVGNPYFGLDPAVLAGSGWLVLMDVTGARLTENRPSSDGRVHIVPEIAARLPETPDRGRTWTFQVKKGFRFSPPSGAPVTAQVVRSSLERALSPKLANSYCRDSILSDIAGEKAYVAGHAQHISGITVNGDRISIKLVAPSWTLPARVAMPCFSVVPPGTPADPDGIADPIPSAGPYYIDDNLPDFQLVLKKNPNYGGGRPQEVDGVIVEESLSPDQAAQLVESGKADYAYDDGDPPSAAFAPGGRLDRAYGSGADPRYVRKPANGTRFLMFNTTRGPMRDVRLRHAVALAVDRQAIAALIDSAPRSLFLSPGVPGYVPMPEPGPRVAQARALVGRRTVPVTLIADASSARADRMAGEVKKDLDRAGFQVRVLLLADPWAYARSGGRADLLLDGWSNDYPDAQNSFTDLLDPRDGFHFYPAWFKDARWLGRMRAAAAAPEGARAADYRRLDRDLASGPLPATGLTENVSSPQFFSARVTCASYLPQFSGLADPTSLCLNR